MTDDPSMTATQGGALPPPRPWREDPAILAAVGGDPRLEALAQLAFETRQAEADAKAWRDRRNAEILRLRALDEPPGIKAVAAVAGIQHGYVSRVIIGGGRPATGHDEVRARAARNREQGVAGR